MEKNCGSFPNMVNSKSTYMMFDLSRGKSNVINLYLVIDNYMKWPNK